MGIGIEKDRIFTDVPVEVIFDKPVGPRIMRDGASASTFAYEILRLWTTENGDFVQEIRVGGSFCSLKDIFERKSRKARAIALERLRTKPLLLRMRMGWEISECFWREVYRRMHSGTMTVEQAMEYGIPRALAKVIRDNERSKRRFKSIINWINFNYG